MVVLRLQPHEILLDINKTTRALYRSSISFIAVGIVLLMVSQIFLVLDSSVTIIYPIVAGVIGPFSSVLVVH